MSVDTSPELEAAAASVLASILHAESPVPVPIGFDMLLDAGCEDRSDVAYLLFREVGEMLERDLGPRPDWDSRTTIVVATSRRIIRDAWDSAWAIARKIRGQTIPAGRLLVTLNEQIAAIPGLSLAGITLTVQRMAIQDWAARLPRVLTVLREVEQHEAE